MLNDIYQDNKLKIAFVYFVFLIEFVIFACLPFLFGKAIDHFVHKEKILFFIYVIVCGIGLLIGYYRRRLDTRVFLRIWKNCSTKAIRKMHDQNIETHKIVSRTSLIGNYSEFFETTMPLIFSSIINIIVSLGMIFYFSIPIGLVILIMFLLGLIGSYYWSNLLQKLEIQIQHIKEEIYNQIIQKNFDQIDKKYEEQLDKHIERSDKQASNWSFMDILSTFSEIAILYFFLTLNSQSQISELIGSIMATNLYNGKIWMSLCNLNYVFSQLKSLEIANSLINSEGS